MRITLTRRGNPVQDLRAGLVLRASAQINAGPFRNSRVLLAKYSIQEGSVGFIMNRIAVYNGARVNIGGPVDQNRVLLLHNYPAPNSLQIINGLYMGGDLSQAVEPRVVALNGYAGWFPLQLDGEVRAGDWEIEGEVDLTEVLGI